MTGDIVGLLIVAIIFGLVNAFIRPIVKLLTLPLSIITLGLFSLVINALMLLLTALLTDGLAIQGGFLEQFFWALVGGVVISIVSTVLNWFLPD